MPMDEGYDNEGRGKKGKSLAVIIASKIPRGESRRGNEGENDDDSGEDAMMGLRSAMGDFAKAAGLRDADTKAMARAFMEAAEIASGMSSEE